MVVLTSHVQRSVALDGGQELRVEEPRPLPGDEEFAGVEAVGIREGRALHVALRLPQRT